MNQYNKVNIILYNDYYNKFWKTYREMGVYLNFDLCTTYCIYEDTSITYIIQLNMCTRKETLSIIVHGVVEAYKCIHLANHNIIACIAFNIYIIPYTIIIGQLV